MSWTPDVVIYHDKCIDGFTAAWACALRWPDVEFIADNYGRVGNIDYANLADKNVLFVDYSLPEGTLREMITVWAARSIVILDHHKSAQEALAPFRRYADGPERFTPATAASMVGDLQRGGYSPILALFDMNRSGAGLAWDFAMATQRPRLVDLVEDRDLWRFRFGDDSRNLHLALTAGETTFDRWADACENLDRFLEAGRSISSYRDSLIDEIVQRAWMGEIDGKPAAMVDCPYLLASETGHRLLSMFPDAAFVALRVGNRDNITFSLRSEDDRADVSAIAGKFGGGGHRNAAGFRVPR